MVPPRAATAWAAGAMDVAGGAEIATGVDATVVDTEIAVTASVAVTAEEAAWVAVRVVNVSVVTAVVADVLVAMVVEQTVVEQTAVANVATVVNTAAMDVVPMEDNMDQTSRWCIAHLAVLWMCMGISPAPPRARSL